MSETVSCIITSYNNWPYLPKAVESVLNQSRKPDEIIIADDGSGDGCRDYLEGLVGNHPEITLILRPQNLGVARNRDLAIRSAKSVFVTTLDGDDLYFPDKIKAELKALKGRSGVVAFSDVDNLDAGGNLVGHAKHEAFSRADSAGQFRYLLHYEGLIPRDMMMAKTLYEKSGGFRDGFALYEDWDFKLRLTHVAERWVSSGVVGVGYRQHGLGLSRLDVMTHVIEQLKVIGENRNMLKQEFGEKEVYMALLRCVARGTGARGVQLVP